MMEIFSTLTREQQLAAQSLADTLSREMGVAFKLDASVFSSRCFANCAHALDWDGDRLAAVATLNNWGEDEPEGTFVCDNERLRGLIAFAVSKLPPETKRFWVINDRLNRAAAEIIQAEGFAYSNTERQLVLNTAKFAPVTLDGLETRRARASDKALVEEFNKTAWEGDYPIAVTIEMLSETIFGVVGGKPVAKLMTDTNRDTGVCGLFGVVIRPDMRGKGLGKAFMGRVIETLIAEGYKRIYLQADSDNAAANGLYAALGFELECELDYYALKKEKTR